MRHRWRQLVRTLWVVSVFLSVVGQGAPATAAEPPSWTGSPVLGVVRLAPLDRLQRDFEFLAGGGEGNAAKAGVSEVLSDLSGGIDPRRPAGAVVYFEGSSVPVIFLPLKDEQRLFAVLAARFGWEFRREADGQYRYRNAESDVDVAARVSGSWVYFTGFSNRQRLQTVPEDPAVLFEGSDPTLTAEATFHFAQFPEELRAEVLGKIGELAAPAGGNAIAQGSTALVEQFLQRICSQTESLQLELQCFRPLQQFHVSARLTAVEGSWLEGWIEDAAQRQTLFSHLPSRDAVFALIASLKLDADLARRLAESWKPLAAQAKAAVPSPQSRDRAEALLGRLVEQAVDAVTATVQSGELDGGLVVERQGRDQVVLLAGTTLLGARAVDQAAAETAQILQQAAEFRAMQWSRTAVGDTAIHRLHVPVTDETARTLLGNPTVLALGAGPDRFYTAIGGNETLTRMSEALERSREEDPDCGDLIRLRARLAPLLALLAAVPGSNADNDRQLQSLAGQIAPYKKNDTLELSLKAIERAVEGRLQVDMGIVRMLASNVPVNSVPPAPPPAPPRPIGQGHGVLRLPAGERFQLEFHTTSRVTTKIDDAERHDRGVHWLTFDFRVDRIDSDGTMHLATSLSRAKIDKQTPDGRESFDSANPPEPERMTAEMLLHATAVGQAFMLAIRPDGTIAAVSGLAEAIENALDTKLQPSANEREQARKFVSQILNESQFRDSLTRGFEFYPGSEIAEGARWTRTTRNLSQLTFLLDNQYQLTRLSPEELLVTVRSQVRTPAAGDGRDQPVRWEVKGSQAGTIKLDPQTGRLRLAEYTLQLDAEATIEERGTTVVRPIKAVFEMLVGAPQQVAEKLSGRVPASPPESPVEAGPAGAAPLPFERDSVAGKPFRLSWRADGQRGFLSGLTLEADGRITGIDSDDIAFWQIDRSGSLVFLGRNRSISTTFDQQAFRDGRWFLSGTFQRNRSLTHLLEEVPKLPKVLDDETLNRIIRPWSKQRIVGLNPGESYRFELADGTARVVRVEQVQDARDSVLGLVRQADVRVRIDGEPVELVCAPYGMPTEIAGLRIQADITSGMLPELPKQVQLSLWDARDPIVNTEAFAFPLRDYRLFSHGMQAYNETVWLGLYDGDPRGVTERHSYGIDIAGFENGETVLAVTDGVVSELWRDTEDPYAVLIEANGVIWEYGHLQSVLPEIREGVSVRRGQPIGILGKRGGSGNFSHLHLGLHPSPAHRAAAIRTQQLNFFPWILTAYRAANRHSLFALAGGHQVIRTGETCAFDASRSLSFDSKIASSSWRFHDGESVDRPQARRSYTRPGTYVAELWIEDDRGERDVDFCRVKVFPRSSPVQGIPTIFMTHTPTADVRPGQPVRFRCWLQAENDAPLLLDFGDGTDRQPYTSYSETSHTFEAPGLYVVTATATVDGMPIMQKQKVLVTAGGRSEADSPPSADPVVTAPPGPKPAEQGADGVRVARFTAEKIRTWRTQLREWAAMPESAPEGWSKSRSDPAKLLTLFPELKVRQGYVLRAYQFRADGNGSGFVWALPVDAAFPDPDEAPRLQGHFLNPPKPFDALDDLMEAVTGDDSPESYLHASIVRREWRDFGAGWHGIDWGAHTVLDDSPWKGGPPRDDQPASERPESRPSEWKWSAGQPDDWSPQVRLEANQAIVTFYTYTALGKEGADGEEEKERIIRHTDTYRRGKYRALVLEKKIAEGPDAVAF